MLLILLLSLGGLSYFSSDPLRKCCNVDIQIKKRSLFSISFSIHYSLKISFDAE
jgi:hypothetical protein